MKRVLLNRIVTILAAIILPVSMITAQCVFEIQQSDTTICKNEIITLTANGRCGVLMKNDFDDGTVGSGWLLPFNPLFYNPCPPTNLPASGLTCWMGFTAGNNRSMVTQIHDLNGRDGCLIEFDMKYAANQGNNCEAPDLPTEGVFLQYRQNTDTSWTTISYWAPNGPVPTGPLYTWNHFSEVLPVAAANLQNTKIRWYQESFQGPEWDHWGVDNISIICDEPQSIITWYPGGDTGNTFDVNIAQATNIIATITDGYNAALDFVKINVYPSPINPIGNDTVICENHIIQLELPVYADFPIWSTGSGQNSIILDSNYLSTDSLVWVEYTDSAGCRLRDSIIVLLDDCAGIDDEFASGFKVYPQPSNGQLSVSWPGHPIDAIKLFDMQGHLILDRQYRDLDGSIQYTFNKSVSGTYILQVQSGNVVLSRRVSIISVSD